MENKYIIRAIKFKNTKKRDKYFNKFHNDINLIKVKKYGIIISDTLKKYYLYKKQMETFINNLIYANAANNIINSKNILSSTK